MSSAGFEPAIPASERPQIQALDRAATGIGPLPSALFQINSSCTSLSLYCLSQWDGRLASHEMQCRCCKAQLRKAQESLGTEYTAYLNSASPSLLHGSCDHSGGRGSIAVLFVLGFVVNKGALRHVFLQVIRFPPITAAWHVLRSGMKERPQPPIWRVNVKWSRYRPGVA